MEEQEDGGIIRVVVVLFITALLTLIFIVQVWYMYIKPWNHFPVIATTIPIFGHLFSFPDRENEMKARTEWFRNIGDTVIVWMLMRPVIVTQDVDIVEHILNSNTMTTKSDGYSYFRDWIQDGLICSDGEKWQRRRKQLTRCFHFEVLKSSLTCMESHSLKLMKKLETFAKSKTPFNALEFSKRFSLGVICESAMGLDLDAIDTGGIKIEDYIESIAATSWIMVKRERIPFYWFKPIFKLFPDGKLYYKSIKIINDFVRNIIEAKLEEHNQKIQSKEENSNRNTRKILLDSLFELYEKGEIDVDGIVEETNTFLFAGHDTVSTTLSWSLYLLGRNKSCQDKAFQEVTKVKNMNIETLEDRLAALKYVDCVIKETLRLHPTAPLIARYIKEETEVNGVIIPKGSDIGFDFYNMQRLEKYWSNPLQFQPERFQDQTGSKRPIFSYVPFSAGPRNCIGSRFATMELKVALYNILLNFELDSTQEEGDLMEVVDVVHHSANGLFINFTKRE